MIFQYDDYLETDGTTTFIRNMCVILIVMNQVRTLRFMVPIFYCFVKQMFILQDRTFGKRPLDVYYKIFDEQNIIIYIRKMF